MKNFYFDVKKKLENTQCMKFYQKRVKKILVVLKKY